MSTDAEGHPYIVTYWRDADSEIPQYRLVWNDGKGWQNRQIMNRSLGFSLKGGGTKMIPISRPRIAVDKGKAYFVFRDAERGSKVSMAYTDDVKSGMHLIRSGHENIAILCGSEDREFNRERIEGYKRALRDNQIPIQDQYIVDNLMFFFLFHNC